MTERFPKLLLDDDSTEKANEPVANEASGPQASQKKLPPPLPARRAPEPPARTAAAVPAKAAAKPPLPARPAPAEAAKPAALPRAARPAEPARPAPPRAAAPAPAAAPLGSKKPKPAATEVPQQRPSPGAYHVSSAPEPLAPKVADAPAAPAPSEVAAKPAAEAPAEAAWFSSLLDSAWTEEAPSPVAPATPADVASSARDSTRDAISGVTRAAAPAEKLDASRAEPLESSLCAFWIKKRCFALDVSLVGEVVSVETVVPVPLTPSAFVGLFNLRGTPMALVDLAEVLELDEQAARPATEPRAGLCALVFRSSRLTAAAVIDRMEAVLPAGRETFTRPESADNPLVTGFVEVRHRPGLVVTVLDPARVIERLERLKYAQGAGV
jgi:chemotaxis signal transduction protein